MAARGGRVELAACVPLAARALLGLLLAAVFASACAGAQTLQRIQHVGRPAFRCEVLPFQPGDSAFVAVRVEVPYAELSFHRAGTGLEARFDLILLLLDDGRQVGGDIWHERIAIPGRDALRGRQARYERQFLLPIEPGERRLEIVLSEPGSGHEGRVSLAFDLPLAFASGARLSPILIGPCGLSGRTTELIFDERVRTEFVDPPESLCAYAEVTGLEPGADPVRVLWRLEGESDAVEARRGEFSEPAAGEAARLAWTLPTRDLLMESYRLSVEVETGGARLSGQASFGLRMESDEALGPFFRDMLDALGYIADEQEVRVLRMAAPEDRRRFWDEFWARRDPTPDTDRNEFKEEFFERLQFANREFGATRPGWTTDRGRIYIRLGAPDTIERMLYRPDGLPTEIWYYASQGLQFIFVDRGGFGDYVLWQSG